MRRRVRISTIVFLFLCSCGTHTRLSPFVRGTVLENNAPVAGVDVILSVGWDDYACHQVSRRTMTDDQGEFRLQEITNRYWLPLLGDPFLQWHLCLRRDGRQFRGLTVKV